VAIRLAAQRFSEGYRPRMICSQLGVAPKLQQIAQFRAFECEGAGWLWCMAWRGLGNGRKYDLSAIWVHV
jgi:hypothetical protein